MVIILRLAVLLQRNRSNTELPEFEIAIDTQQVTLKFPNDWLQNSPLTQADLNQEIDYLAKAKFTLNIS